jgi:AcrR family transcriptional regulator
METSPECRGKQSGHLLTEPLDAENPKRNAILMAAARVFLEHGYEPVSMDVIAAAANVSKRTVYSYFESKTVLFSSIMLAHCRSSIAPPIHQKMNDPHEVLADFGRAFVRMMTSSRAVALQRVIFREVERFPELGKAFFENGPARHLSELRGYLQQAAVDGKLKMDDPARAAVIFVAMVQAPFQLQQLCGLVDDVPMKAIERSVRVSVALFLNAFETERPARRHRSPIRK